MITKKTASGSARGTRERQSSQHRAWAVVVTGATLAGLALASSMAAQAAPASSYDNRIVIAGNGTSPATAISPDGTEAYVTNSDDSTVSMIDLVSGTIKATVRVPEVSDPVLSSDGTRLYVGQQTVSAIDTHTDQIIMTAHDSGAGGHGSVLTTDGSTLFQPHFSGNTVAAIDTATASVTSIGPVGAKPINLTLSPDNSHLYVTSYDSDSVTIIDTATRSVVATIPLGSGNAVGATISPDGSRLYVEDAASGLDNGRIKVVDLASDTIVANIEIGNISFFGSATDDKTLSISPDGSHVYAVNQTGYSSNGSVSVIDTATNTVSATVPIETAMSTYAALSPQGSELYVTNLGSGGSTAGSISVIDTATNTVSTTIPLSRWPGGQAYEGPAISANGAYLVQAQSGGSWDNDIVAVPLTAPTGLTISAQTTSGATLQWLHPLSAAPVSQYTLERSTDGGATWHQVPGAASGLTHAEVAIPAPGAAYRYRVAATTASGTSPASTPITVANPGTSSQTLTIQTPTGQPIAGGTVTWKASDGNSGSATPSTLTADGVVTFPEVVPGDATVSVVAGLLPDGTIVYGFWPVALGTDPQVLATTEVPPLRRPTVNVTLPNGVPVVNAHVTVKSDLSPTVTRYLPNVDGQVDFHAPDGSAAGITDDNGNAQLAGYEVPNTQPTVRVTYSDGVLNQGQTVTLTGARTSVQLQYMPWLTVSGPDTTTPDGTMQSLTFAVNNTGTATHAGTTVAAAATPRATIPPVAIAITPPNGWTAKRCTSPSTTSGKTNTRGKLTLRMCASASGWYHIKSHGAVPAHGVFLRVKGAPSTPPTSISARSPRPGQLRVSWGTPVYSGGAPVTAYRVTATSPNYATHTATITSAKFTSATMQQLFRGLAESRTWTVHVYAVTRYGSSTAAIASLRVA